MRHIVIALLLLAGAARAENESPRREASAHFQRGVDLYNDGDFRGALVEFKKAYAIWPRANVLYDVGQTEFQLMDYAAALKTMERYLAETGPNAAHRSEVENTVEILRGRVGRIALATSVPDCDVSIDDQAVGTTPLQHAILVSVGARKLAIHCPARPVVTRQVEIAAGETVRIDPKLPLPAAVASAMRTPASPAAKEGAPLSARASMAIGWSFSAVLAAATIAVGTATLVEQSRLGSMKSSFPVMRDQLERQGNLTLGLSIASDALAAASVVAIGVSAYLTVKYQRERKLKLGLAGAGMFLSTTF